MPWGDWQFYVVTLAAVVGFWILLRTLVRPFLTRRGGTSSKRTALTIEGRKKR